VTTDVAELVGALVAIDSVNPKLVPGGAGESAIADFVASWSRAAGLEVEVLDQTPGRPSLLARARGNGRAPACCCVGRLLTELQRLDAALADHVHPLLGRGSVHASTIQGGTELSTYPARCVLGLERRTLPGETAAAVERELAELLDRCRTADPELLVEQRTLLVREPFEIAADHPFVQEVRAAAEAATGTTPEVDGGSYWTDAAFIAATGAPTVLYGPTGDGAHAPEEWVSLRATELAVRTLVHVAQRVCG